MAEIRCPHHPDQKQAFSVLFEVTDGVLSPVVLFDDCGDKVAGLVEAADHLPPTVGQLRAVLGRMPQDAYVILSRDSAGSHFSPFHALDTEGYLPHSASSGRLTRADEPGALPAVVLWPAS